MSVSLRGKPSAAIPDFLLTTPESLEAILISRVTDPHVLLRSVRTVIVDELHAFAGDDRGTHLNAVLARISRIAGRELQRIGLSATIGNPDELLDWLAAGNSGPRRVIAAGDPPGTSEVVIDHVGSLSNAAHVVAGLHGGQKRLVFCDSRARVEELATALRERDVVTFVSHGSLGVDERRRAEEAFATATDCVIVATSTLELGLDVGDLDRVIQIDAPGTVAAFLQRMGRTGRRPGIARNTLFLATTDEALLVAASITTLAAAGEIEPIAPPPLPYHLFAQQLLAMSLQERRISLGESVAELLAVPPFDDLDRDEAGLVARFLVDQEWLTGDDGLVSAGPESERTLGYRHFAELTSSFTADPEISVRYGQLEVGRVHPLTFPRRDERSWHVLLGGRTWHVESIDWRRRIAHAVPATGAGKSRWRGDARALPAAICRQMCAVLAGSDPPARLSKRGSDRLANLRREFTWADCDSTTVVGSADETRWWTFAGLRANDQLRAALGPLAAGAQAADNLSIELATGTPPDAIAARLEPLRSDPYDGINSRLDGRAADLKFAECLPPRIADAVVRHRAADVDSVADVLGQSRRSVTRTT